VSQIVTKVSGVICQHLALALGDPVFLLTLRSAPRSDVNHVILLVE